MTYRVVILPRAESDVESFARWWAEHHDSAQAEKWFDAIHQQLKLLSEFPEGYSLSAENDDFPYVIRDKLLGLGSRPSYRAVFTIKDNTVYVLAIRRTSQNRFPPDAAQHLE